MICLFDCQYHISTVNIHLRIRGQFGSRVLSSGVRFIQIDSKLYMPVWSVWTLILLREAKELAEIKDTKAMNMGCRLCQNIDDKNTRFWRVLILVNA